MNSAAPHVATPAPSRPSAHPASAPLPRAARPDRPRRLRRILASAAVALVALIAAMSASNGMLTLVERATTPAYGERVAVTGGSLNVYRHGTSGPTIVMLGGYATPAPALDYAPLIRELDDYQVVVVEGFGYGYSDTDAPPRTVENITAELHEALAASGVDGPYVLLGHSIAGLYSLYYANHYRSEISAVVGIDASVPGQLNGLAGQGDPMQRLLPLSGLLRVASTLVPGLVEPDGDAYTPAERARLRMMSNWNYANPAVLDEANQGAHNFAAVDDLRYPEGLPVLSFIKKEGSQAGWRELHAEQLTGLTRGELVELDGGHYLHWTHAAQLADTIRTFLVDAEADR